MADNLYMLCELSHIDIRSLVFVTFKFVHSNNLNVLKEAGCV